MLESKQKQSKKKKKLLSDTLALGYLCQLRVSWADPKGKYVRLQS